ncbi:MAG: hypothetical protein ABIH48_00315 [Candidatus Falkowbacteria bacterium]
MTDVYKGKPHMTEEYYENRTVDSGGPASTIADEGWTNASQTVLRRDRDMLNEILDELESPLE